MKKGRIHIGNLRIELPRSMRNQARSVASVIGNDVARTIADAASGQSGNIKIGEISVGRVQDISAVGANAASKITERLSDRGKN